MPTSIVFHRSHIGPAATAVADVIEKIQVVERGRLTFATMAGVGPGDIGFDQSSGRFFVLDRNRSGRILEIAATLRARSSVSTEFAKRLQPAHMHPLERDPAIRTRDWRQAGSHDTAAIKDVLAGR